MKIIETSHIAKVYKMGTNIVNALQDVTITIDKGEYVAFMGPSGSGKSTLMNIVGCLDSPTTGTYMLNNKLVSQMTENELAETRNKEIGFVFQTFNLLPRATALIWLDLSWEECKRGLTDRGLRRGMTTEDHAALVVWAADYWTRDNANSFNGHFRLFEAFRGLQVRLKSRAQIDQFSASVVEWSGEDQG